MKKQLLLILMTLLPMVTWADEVEINGIYYNLNTPGSYRVDLSNVVLSNGGIGYDIPSRNSELNNTGETPPMLHVEGRFFVDEQGKRVNLHGFAQTFSPWFNERDTKWTDYDVAGCLAYNKGIIDGILNAGWKMTFVRQHMDPYWSNTPGEATNGEADIHAFDYERFKKYLDEVFVPMAEYAISKGLYVVMRPPGVCPEKIYIGGDYHQYLRKVWACVVQHPKLKNNGAILFELCNEPVQICDRSGNAVNNWDDSTFDKRGQLMTEFMQDLVNMIQAYDCNNILLIPGLHYQMLYSTFGKYPVKGDNIGYAVHCYPGWYNSGYDKEVDVVYDNFKSGWNNEIKPVADIAPVVVTEMDWAPEKYESSWGKAITGKAGENGFGANFMRICDETCNVSWLLFTAGNLLAQYDDTAPDGDTFLTDPEACPRPVYRKYQIYATKEYSDMINEPSYGTGIGVIHTKNGITESEKWYMMDGRCLDGTPTKKGVYIVNGRKVVVK